eukprot:Sdes_comp20724_c0_seq14m16501
MLASRARLISTPLVWKNLHLPARTLAYQSAAYTTSAGREFLAYLNSTLDEIQKAGTFKKERIITSRQNPTISVEGSEFPEILNFCANNYLGLSGNDEIASAAVDATFLRGAGLSSVRFICGTHDIHLKLEKQISKFHNTQDTILYPSCFDANAGLFEAILGAEDAILSDELNHASIIDGIRLCKNATKYRYKHRNMTGNPTFP